MNHLEKGMRRYGLSGNFDFVHLKIVSHHRIKAGIFNKSKKKKKLIHTKPIFLIVLTLSKLSKKKKKMRNLKKYLQMADAMRLNLKFG